MAKLNATTLLRGQISAASRAYGQQEMVETPQEEPKTFQDLSDLRSFRAAGKRVMALQFECYCKVDSRTGIHSFHQQLENGMSFSCTPVMPKDLMGNEVSQPGVYNGAHGYLVLRVSDNAKLSRTETGRLEISVRPEFVAYVPTLEEAEKLEAASNPKPAAKK